jgi:phage recombination protein Bet
MTDKALITTGQDPDVQRAMTLFQERLKPMKDVLGCKDLTDPELQMFAMVCIHTGLDPFLKQIHAIKRGGRMTIQTGIDGYRSTAEDTHEYAGSDEAEYEECDCGEDDSPPHHPSVARVVVHRILPSGHVVDQTGVARWHELKPAHYKSEKATDFQDAMWWKMPYNQLSKCAEANGLRKAFPRVLGGVYINEEMEQANTFEGTATDVTPRTTVKDRVAEIGRAHV